MATIPYTDDYLAFYDDYPRHEGKQEGQKAWDTLSENDRKAAHADVLKRKRMGAYSSNKKKIQLPASYLRAGRWQDDWQDTLESSRKSEDVPVSRGTVNYEPRKDDFTGNKWAARANRRLREYLFTIGGIRNGDGSIPGSEEVPPRLQEMIDEKKRIATEYGPAFDEDLQAGARPADVADEFDGAIFSALDRVCGYNLKHRMMRNRSGK